MRVTKRSLAILSVVLVCCIAATLLLCFAGREKEEETQAATYFFAKYDSADSLMAASIENASGSVTIATEDGTCYIAGDYDQNPNAQAMKDFFARAYRLPLECLLDGASSTEDQYGLITPQATVMLQDVNHGGLVFKIGSQTFDEKGWYTCLSGDDRVFIMADEYAELFLMDVKQFYDFG